MLKIDLDARLDESEDEINSEGENGEVLKKRWERFPTETDLNDYYRVVRLTKYEFHQWYHSARGLMKLTNRQKVKKFLATRKQFEKHIHHIWSLYSRVYWHYKEKRERGAKTKRARLRQVQRDQLKYIHLQIQTINMNLSRLENNSENTLDVSNRRDDSPPRVENVQPTINISNMNWEFENPTVVLHRIDDPSQPVQQSIPSTKIESPLLLQQLQTPVREDNPLENLQSFVQPAAPNLRVRTPMALNQTPPMPFQSDTFNFGFHATPPQRVYPGHSNMRFGFPTPPPQRVYPGPSNMRIGFPTPPPQRIYPGPSNMRFGFRTPPPQRLYSPRGLLNVHGFRSPQPPPISERNYPATMVFNHPNSQPAKRKMKIPSAPGCTSPPPKRTDFQCDQSNESTNQQQIINEVPSTSQASNINEPIPIDSMYESIEQATNEPESTTAQNHATETQSNDQPQEQQGVLTDYEQRKVILFVMRNQLLRMGSHCHQMSLELNNIAHSWEKLFNIPQNKN